MICVFDVTTGPARGKRFWIRANEKMEVGRISTASFSIPTDLHLSRRHLLIEGNEGAFRVRDLGSANGTFVNDTRITSIELCVGDIVRAGDSRFAVSLLADDQNPHAKDGLNFSGGSQQVPQLDAPPRSVGLAGCAKVDDQTTRYCRIPSPPIAPGGPTSPQSEMIPWGRDFGFQPTGCPRVFEEPQVTDDHFLKVLLDRVAAEFSITAIVNHEKLGRFGKQQVSLLVGQGLVQWLTPMHCSIANDRGPVFQSFVENALTQDAIVLFGTLASLHPTQLAALVTLANCPSEIVRHLYDSSSGLKDELLKAAEFAILPIDRTGRLYALVR